MSRLEVTSGTEPPVSNARRREALRVLRETGEPLALADLAADLVGPAPQGAAPDYEAIRDCRLVLYHVDVPKLAEAGAVEFDADRFVVGAAE